VDTSPWTNLKILSVQQLANDNIWRIKCDRNHLCGTAGWANGNKLVSWVQFPVESCQKTWKMVLLACAQHWWVAVQVWCCHWVANNAALTVKAAMTHGASKWMSAHWQLVTLRKECRKGYNTTEMDVIKEQDMQLCHVILIFMHNDISLTECHRQHGITTKPKTFQISDLCINVKNYKTLYGLIMLTNSKLWQTTCNNLLVNKIRPLLVLWCMWQLQKGMFQQSDILITAAKSKKSCGKLPHGQATVSVLHNVATCCSVHELDQNMFCTLDSLWIWVKRCPTNNQRCCSIKPLHKQKTKHQSLFSRHLLSPDNYP